MKIHNFDQLDVGPPLQRPNRTVTIQMLTPNLNTFNSGSRTRDRTTGTFKNLFWVDHLRSLLKCEEEISLRFFQGSKKRSLSEILERFLNVGHSS